MLQLTYIRAVSDSHPNDESLCTAPAYHVQLWHRNPTFKPFQDVSGACESISPFAHAQMLLGKGLMYQLVTSCHLFDIQTKKSPTNR